MSSTVWKRHPLEKYLKIFLLIFRFATTEMMHQYGVLLQSYLENGEFVNDCIFTMMFHVGCLGEITALFEPNIIKIYSKIWATDYDLRDV